MCLLSCLYNIHKRKEKNKKLLLLAQQSGKGDGDAFRQVTPTLLSLLLKYGILLGQKVGGIFVDGKDLKVAFFSCSVSHNGQTLDFYDFFGKVLPGLSLRV